MGGAFPPSLPLFFPLLLAQLGKKVRGHQVRESHPPWSRGSGNESYPPSSPSSPHPHPFPTSPLQRPGPSGLNPISLLRLTSMKQDLVTQPMSGRTQPARYGSPHPETRRIPSCYVHTRDVSMKGWSEEGVEGGMEGAKECGREK